MATRKPNDDLRLDLHSSELTPMGIRATEIILDLYDLESMSVAIDRATKNLGLHDFEPMPMDVGKHVSGLHDLESMPIDDVKARKITASRTSLAISNLADIIKNLDRQLKATPCLDSVGRINGEIIDGKFGNSTCRY